MELQVCHLLSQTELAPITTSLWGGDLEQELMILPYLQSFPKNMNINMCYAHTKQTTRLSHAHTFSWDKPQRKTI